LELNGAPGRLGWHPSAVKRHPSSVFLMKPVNQVLNRVWPPGKFRFTLIMAALLLLTALITGSWTTTLTPTWQERLGFAPSDLIKLNWDRIFTSALVTSGGLGFWLPFGAMIGLAFAAEMLDGTRQALLAFWLPHLAFTTGGSLLIGLADQLTSSSLLHAIYTDRDVGPSAGYFGCMGLIVSYFPRPWRYLVGFSIIGGLVVGIIFSARQGTVIDVSAGLAHLAAFPLGWRTRFCLASKKNGRHPG
jgi:hypothetical protein